MTEHMKKRRSRGFGSSGDVHARNAAQENKRAARAVLKSVKATQAGNCRVAFFELSKAIRHGAMAESEAFSQTQDPDLESRVRTTGGDVRAASDAFEMYCMREGSTPPARKRSTR